MRKRKHNPAVIAASIGVLSNQIAAREQQRINALAALEAAQQAGQDAQARRDESRLSALGDGDESALQAYREACAAFRDRADAVSETAALIEQIEADLCRLQRDHVAAMQAKARADIYALGDTAIAAAAEVDAALVAVIDGLAKVESIRAQQHVLRAEANLPEIQQVKLQLNDHLKHVLMWRLYPRVGRPRHHFYQQMSLAEAESARQGRTPEGDPADEQAVRQEAIDDALLVNVGDTDAATVPTEH